MDKKPELESRNVCKYIHIRMGCAYYQKGNLDSFEASISSLYKASLIIVSKVIAMPRFNEILCTASEIFSQRRYG